MRVQPYLCFEGRCQEAIDFYQQTLGAEVLMVMRFSDAPQGSCGEQQAEAIEGCGGTMAAKDKVMHAALKIGPDEILMSDGMCTGHAEFKGITLSVSLDSDEQVRETFAAISAGGNVLMAPAPTFFASLWGICTDKFGVSWMVLSPAPVPAAT